MNFILQILFIILFHHESLFFSTITAPRCNEHLNGDDKPLRQ